ncbi:hypothetical protein PGT21_032315 [Puccinia graminis f. sp. tritici]|uniref:Uncharacterized protein n=1 Tax=Puccinia graminis f. sp. tritici TaxID=56615 RepID=A0A5B0PMT4_PUCGR|nr:hypothetical protein PGT21_032315 [Puccinia graminis f. sp. tritici]
MERKASERSPPPVSASQASKPTSSQTSNQPTPRLGVFFRRANGSFLGSNRT